MLILRVIYALAGLVVTLLGLGVAWSAIGGYYGAGLWWLALAGLLLSVLGGFIIRVAVKGREQDVKDLGF